MGTPTRHLLGVDVGFSLTRPTTGIAWLDGNSAGACVARSTWEERRRTLPEGFYATHLALDGPLLPQGPSDSQVRACERALSQAPFHNRCKPGLSHFGTGHRFRLASSEACSQFACLLDTTSPNGPRGHVRLGGPIVEAFPNAFLGVLLPEEAFVAAPPLRRGRRFDWLYDQVAKSGRVEELLDHFFGLPPPLWEGIRGETNHEKRAAWICLLTAALAERGVEHMVGDPVGGWFCLPPLTLWEPWARGGLDRIWGCSGRDRRVLHVSARAARAPSFSMTAYFAPRQLRDLCAMPARPGSKPPKNGMDSLSRAFDVTNLGKWLSILGAPKGRWPPCRQRARRSTGGWTKCTPTYARSSPIRFAWGSWSSSRTGKGRLDPSPGTCVSVSPPPRSTFGS